MIYLDCSLMTTTASLISTDGVWSNSRASELIERLSLGTCANPLVVVDEFDKLSIIAGVHRNLRPKKFWVCSSSGRPRPIRTSFCSSPWTSVFVTGS